MMNEGEATGTSTGTTSSSPTRGNHGAFFSAEHEAIVKQIIEIDMVPKMYKLAFSYNWVGVVKRCSTHPNELRNLSFLPMTPLSMIIFMNPPEIITQPEAVKCICTMARVAPETVLASCPETMNKSPISMIWSMIAKERLTNPVLFKRQKLDVSAVADMIQLDNDTSTRTKVYNHRSEALAEILLKFFRGLKTRVMIPIFQTTFYNDLNLCQLPFNENAPINGITQIDQQLLTGIYLLYSCLVENVPKYLCIISDFDRQVCEDIKQTIMLIKIYDECYLKQDKHEAAPFSATADLSTSVMDDTNNRVTSGKIKKSADSNECNGVIPLSKLHDISKKFNEKNVKSDEENNTTTSLHVAFQNYKRRKNQTPQRHIIHQMIKLFPHWLHMKDTNGFIPLHYICQNVTWFRSNVAYITKMLTTDKTIAQVKTPSGLYPYVFALENKINPSEEGMKTLLDAYPEVLATVNPKTNLRPFMTVALKQPLSWMKMKQLLQTSPYTQVSETYTLLRQMPEILPQHVEKTSISDTNTTSRRIANNSSTSATSANSSVSGLSIFILVSGCVIAIFLHRLKV